MKQLLPRIIGLWLNFLGWVAPRAAGRIGYNLFCTPRPAPVKDYHRDFFNTAEKTSFEMDGLTLQTYRWGHGPKKLLFLHGWQSHSFRWKKYVEQLSRDEFTLYAMDGPAHGLSSGKYMTPVIYGKAIEQFVNRIQPVHAVIAHSVGGFSLLYQLYGNPALPIERLVLMGVPGQSIDFIKTMQAFLGINDRTLKATLDRFQEVAGQPIEFFSTARFAERVTQPVLIIHNDPDDEAPYRYALRLREVIPNSQLITTTEMGHNLKSPQVIQWVSDFVSAQELIVTQRKQ